MGHVRHQEIVPTDGTNGRPRYLVLQSSPRRLESQPNGANMKSKLLVSTMLLVLALPVAAQAQGTVRGAERGAAQGERDAGPLGAVVGGTVGAVAGTIGGILGVEDRPQIGRA